MRKDLLFDLTDVTNCLGFTGSTAGKESASSAGDPVRFLSQEDPLEEG